MLALVPKNAPMGTLGRKAGTVKGIETFVLVDPCLRAGVGGIRGLWGHPPKSARTASVHDVHLSRTSPEAKALVQMLLDPEDGAVRVENPT